MANRPFIANLFELGDARIQRARRVDELLGMRPLFAELHRQIDSAGTEGEDGNRKTET